MGNVAPDKNLLFKIALEFECSGKIDKFLKAYQDSGKVWTIGIGSTYNFLKARKVQPGDVITAQDAVNFYWQEVGETVRLANFYIKKPLNAAQSTAVVDYIYNRGIGNFLKTRIDDLININPNDPAVAAEIEKTGLRDRLGNLLNGLIRRRKCQAKLYATGTLQFRF